MKLIEIQEIHKDLFEIFIKEYSLNVYDIEKKCDIPPFELEKILTDTNLQKIPIDMSKKIVYNYPDVNKEWFWGRAGTKDKVELNEKPKPIE